MRRIDRWNVPHAMASDAKRAGETTIAAGALSGHMQEGNPTWFPGLEPSSGFGYGENAWVWLIRTAPPGRRARLASECEHDHAKAMCEYGLLKRNFEALHRHAEDWAFYHVKVNERRSRPRSWRRPWSKLSQGFEWLVLDLGCRYGTIPFCYIQSLFIRIFYELATLTNIVFYDQNFSRTLMPPVNGIMEVVKAGRCEFRFSLARDQHHEQEA